MLLLFLGQVLFLVFLVITPTVMLILKETVSEWAAFMANLILVRGRATISNINPKITTILVLTIAAESNLFALRV